MQSPFLNLYNQLGQLISYLDINLLALENSQSSLFHLHKLQQTFFKDNHTTEKGQSDTENMRGHRQSQKSNSQSQKSHIQSQKSHRQSQKSHRQSQKSHRQSQKSHRQSRKSHRQNKLKLLSSFLLQDKLTKLSQQINLIIDLHIKTGVTKIHQLINQLITQSSQLHTSFHLPSQTIQQQPKIQQLLSSTIFDQSQSKPPNFQQNTNTKITEILKNNFQLQDHMTGFDKDNFNSLSKNMEFVETKKVKSKDLSTLKLQQKNILDQVISVRQQILNSSNSGYIESKQIIQDSLRKSYSQLFDLYEKLNNLNSYKCICQKVIHPILPLYPNKTVQSIYQQPQGYTSINSILFKIQAQGFVSNQSLHIPSIQQKLTEHILKTKSKSTSHLFKNQPSLSKEHQNVQFLKFQSDLITILESFEKNSEQRYFEFGLINASYSQNFIHQNSFQSVLNSQQIPSLDENLRFILETKHKNEPITESNRFSLKILNIDNKFYIQSQKQAKLIKLSPKWEYFSLQLMQLNQQQTLKTQIKLYGLINKPKTSTSTESFEQQLILTSPLSPSLIQKVLKPYFSFKNFQCKISIKNIRSQNK